MVSHAWSYMQNVFESMHGPTGESKAPRRISFRAESKLWAQTQQKKFPAKFRRYKPRRSGISVPHPQTVARRLYRGGGGGAGEKDPNFGVRSITARRPPRGFGSWRRRPLDPAVTQSPPSSPIRPGRGFLRRARRERARAHRRRHAAAGETPLSLSLSLFTLEQTDLAPSRSADRISDQHTVIFLSLVVRWRIFGSQMC